MASEPSFTTRPEAERQAERIREYWLKRGHAVTVWVKNAKALDRHTWVVRSDMRNGLPRKKA